MNECNLESLCAHGYFLHHIAKDYLNGAVKLYKENNPQDFIYSFCFLATTALELFLKVIITANLCLKKKNNIYQDKESIRLLIIKELKNPKHNIKKLFEMSGIQGQLGITKVEEFNNDFINDYRLYFARGDNLIFKDSESIRFGSLASKQNISVFVSDHYTQKIIDFLDILSKFSFEKFNDAVNLLKKVS